MFTNNYYIQNNCINNLECKTIKKYTYNTRKLLKKVQIVKEIIVPNSYKTKLQLKKYFLVNKMNKISSKDNSIISYKSYIC